MIIQLYKQKLKLYYVYKKYGENIRINNNSKMKSENIWM